MVEIEELMKKVYVVTIRKVAHTPDQIRHIPVNFHYMIVIRSKFHRLVNRVGYLIKICICCKCLRNFLKQ